MKTAKLISGIISIVLFLVILFQSCAAGLSNAISNSKSASGSAGVILALFMLIAGIIGIAARSSKGGAITSGVFYAFGGIVGMANVGTFADLQIWSVLSFIFAAIFIVSVFWGQTYPQKVKEAKPDDAENTGGK